MAEDKKVKINKRRLIRELLILGGIGLVIFLVRFLPWLAEQPIPGYDPYAKYQTLVKAVEEYDYSKGRDSKLESRLTAATKSVDEGPIDFYFDLKAKLYYYKKVGMFSTSNKAAEDALRYAPTAEETLYIYSVLIDNYRSLGNEEKAAEYDTEYKKLEELLAG